MIHWRKSRDIKKVYADICSNEQLIKIVDSSLHDKVSKVKINRFANTSNADYSSQPEKDRYIKILNKLKIINDLNIDGIITYLLAHIGDINHCSKVSLISASVYNTVQEIQIKHNLIDILSERFHSASNDIETNRKLDAMIEEQTKHSMDISHFDFNYHYDICVLNYINDHTETSKEIISALQSVFYIKRDDMSLYGLIVDDSKRKIIKIPLETVNARMMLYKTKVISVYEFLCNNTHVYVDTVNKLGKPSVIDKNGKFYINTYLNTKETTDESNTAVILEKFMQALSDMKVCNFIPDTPYFIDEMYEFYKQFNATYKQVPFSPKVFSTSIQKYVIDVTVKGTCKAIAPSSIPSGSIVKSSCKGVNKMCYYVYSTNFPQNTRIPTGRE